MSHKVLSASWRRLATSYIAATEDLPISDPIREHAQTRAQSYRDCADELDNFMDGMLELIGDGYPESRESQGRTVNDSLTVQKP